MSSDNKQDLLVSFNQFMVDLIDLLKLRFSACEFLESDIDGSKFEKIVFESIEILQIKEKSKYSRWIPTLVSGKKFPDIVLQMDQFDKFGIEVKTSKGSDWKTLGGSIMESTRVDGVNHITVLFAKANPFEVRFKSFDECVSDVAVTHSPRYLIDLDVDADKTIFKKIEVKYDDVWKSEKPFESFRQYFKNKALKEKTGLWWIDDGSTNVPEELPGLEIQLFYKLPKEKRDYLISKSMILFPEIFSEVADYDEISIWLANMGILHNSLRDSYSAGGNIDLLGFTVPSKYKRLKNHLSGIQNIFRNINKEDLLRVTYKTENPNMAYDLWVKKLKSSSPIRLRNFLTKLFDEYPFT